MSERIELDEAKRKYHLIIHDIKSPLNILESGKDIIKDKFTQGDYQSAEELSDKFIEKIINLNTFVSDYLKFERDIDSFIYYNNDDVIEKWLLQISLYNEKHIDVNIHFDTAKDSLESQLYGDIGTIIRNIFSNMVKYSNPDKVEILISDSDNNNLEILMIFQSQNIDIINLREGYNPENSQTYSKSGGFGSYIINHILDKYNSRLEIIETDGGVSYRFQI